MVEHLDHLFLHDAFQFSCVHEESGGWIGLSRHLLEVNLTGVFLVLRAGLDPATFLDPRG